MPLSKAYGSVIGIRNALFDRGIFKEKNYDVPILSVGNLSVGGTGKTPVVAHFVKHFLKASKNVCIVSRGYGGNYSGDAARVDVSQPHSATIYGDEPVWFARSLSVPVFVGRERRKAVELCLRTEKPDLIIADDGFQHRWLGRDRDIVLLDANEKSPALLPSGRFREPISSLQRADFVFLTKANLAARGQVEYWTQMVAEQGFSESAGNLFTVEYGLGPFQGIADAAPFVVGSGVLVASAIARPQSFEQLVLKQARVLKHFVRGDHHRWTQSDVNEIKSYGAENSVPSLVVTEKDFVKISDLDFSGLNLYVVPLEITLSPEFPYDRIFD